MYARLKIGDNVRSIGLFSGIEGIITDYSEWEQDGPLSVENHGSIEIKVTKITNNNRYHYLKIGDLEHFVVHNWQKHLERIEPQQTS